MDDPNIEKRTASGITVNLSSFLITGSLAVVGAQAVVVTFVLDKREHLFIFGLLSLLALVSLLGGVVAGGKGIYALARRGYDGTWDVVSGSGIFNLQAILTLTGVLLVAITTLLGTPKGADSEHQSLREVTAARAEVAQLAVSVNLLAQKEVADRQQIERLSEAQSVRQNIKAKKTGSQRARWMTRSAGKTTN